MRFKFKTILLSGILLAGGGQLNAQKNAWAMFSPSSNYLNLQISSSTSNWGQTLPRLKNPHTNQYFTSYLGFNVQTDITGKPLFYVLSTTEETFLFDRNGIWVPVEELFQIKKSVSGGYTNYECSPEITIIPLEPGVIYHILSSGNIWEYNLTSNTIDNKNFEYGTCFYPGYNFSSNGKKNGTAMQACYKISTGNCDEQKYRIYSLKGNGTSSTYRGIAVTEVVVPKYGQNKVTLIHDYDITSINGVSSSFNNYQTEMELSADASKLSIIEQNRVLVFNVKSDGKIDGLNNTFSFNSNGSTYRIAGLEFIDNTKLMYSLFDGSNSSFSSRGVYTWNFSGTGNPSKVSGSEDFSNSNIERAKNNAIYLPKANGIYEFNTSTNTISAAFTGVTLHKNEDMYTTFYPTDPIATSIYYLPDQLDGQVHEFLDLSETVFTFNFGTSSTGSYNWSNSSHGFTSKGSGRVFVINSINLRKYSSPVILDGVQLEFFTDASLNLFENSSLTLKGALLKSADCGLMWQGITLLKGNGMGISTLTIQKNAAGVASQIQDAYTGVKTLHKYHNLNIKENSKFLANEVHVQIVSNKVQNVSIVNSIFTGDVPLKDQYRGVNMGYVDNKNRTIVGIKLLNANVKIGELATKNIIKGGQIGVEALSSNLELVNNEILEQKQYGCRMDAGKTQNKKLIVNTCLFHDLQQGIRIENGVNETFITQNQFLNTAAYAIQYVNNHGGQLNVGDLSNSLLGNLFNNCNWAAIQCFDNNLHFEVSKIDYGTKINIANNTIDNHVYAAGISIGEPLSASRSYALLNIASNNIGQQQPLGKGILLNRINGANPDNPRDVHIPTWDEDFKINGNKITYTTQLSISYTGISGIEAKKLNFTGNNCKVHSSIVFNTSRKGSNGGKAMSLIDGSGNLVARNELKGSWGLELAGNGIFSNYYCNKLVSCVRGIELSDPVVLRNTANCSSIHNDNLIHAHFFNTKFYGRHNVFVPTITWGSDIYVRPANQSNLMWDFVDKKFYKVDYFGPRIGCGIRHHDFRENFCENVGGAEIPPQSSDSAIHVDFDNISDTVLKWYLQYSVAQDVASGRSFQTVLNSNINKLVEIEIAIENQNYGSAQFKIANFNPSNGIESDYKTVYSIWVEKKLADESLVLGSNKFVIDTLWLDSVNYELDTLFADTSYINIKPSIFDSSQMAMLTSIATKNGLKVSPAAYAARTLLLYERELEFYDSIEPFTPVISGFVNSNCAIDSNQIFTVYLKNQLGNIVAETLSSDSGYFSFSDSFYLTLDSSSNYFVTVLLNDSTWMNSSTYNPELLAIESPHIFDCSTSAQNGMANWKNEFNMNGIEIYPNPAENCVYLKNLPSEWKLIIYGIGGNKIGEFKNTNGNIVDVSEMATGLYYFSIINLRNNDQFTQKVLVQR